MNQLLNRLKPFLYVGGLYIIISLVLRIIFMAHPITTTSFSIWQVLGMLLVGSLNDGFIICLALSILVLYFLFIANVKYQKPYGYIILGAMLLLLGYIQFVPNNILSDGATTCAPASAWHNACFTKTSMVSSFRT